jgi:Mg-chelatase subunit ChlD
MHSSMRAIFSFGFLAVILALAAGPTVTARTQFLGQSADTTAARGVLQPAPICSASVDKTAAPAEVQLGQVVTVTLSVNGSCPIKDQPADIILAIDHSTSMTREGKLQAAQDAAIKFINQSDPKQVRIGLVSVSSVGRKIEDLTTDWAVLVQAVQNLQPERGTNLVDGLESSRRALIGANARPGVRKVIIFLTDGKHSQQGVPESDLDPVIAAVRTAGIEVFTIGLGTDADEGTLKRIASDASHYYFSPTTGELEGIYLQIAGRLQAKVLFTTSTIADVLPANMVYVPGSARPTQPSVSADGRTLTWQVDNVAEPGYQITYQVRPQEVGTWPTNAVAKIEYVDGFKNTGNLVFPVPTVRVKNETPGGAQCVCRIVLQRVPQHVIDAALAHPERFHGWRYPLDPGKPRSPANPPRECLTLMNVNIDYHPLWNTPEWRVGCP